MRNIANFIAKVEAERQENPKYRFPIQPPKLYPGVLPANVKKPLIAMDNSPYEMAGAAYLNNPAAGFPGYAYLAQLATRSEFRQMASVIATELTREWIKFTSSDVEGSETSDKITKLEQELKKLNVQQVLRLALENDCYFGRGQIFIDIKGQETKTELPLVLSNKTIALGSLRAVRSIEPMWTTPNQYNAGDPTTADFYKPMSWFVMGKKVHANRLLTIITRELPDMLKPAYNFSGMSLSQLAEPYVDNWLRTRQNVSDLVAKFSVIALSTSMSDVLQGDGGTEAASELINRVKLFNLMRSNFGTMLMDKDREELVMLNVPLSGLHELQAQAQEHLCSVSHLPAVILTGISPTGFGNLAEGEMQAHYNRTSALQEAYVRPPLETIIKVAQISLFGAIDPNINFEFNPLYQMTPKENAEIRKLNAETAAVYTGASILGPDEERERLARDHESGYQGIDVNRQIESEGDEDEDEDDGLGLPDDSDGKLKLERSGKRKVQQD